MAIVKTHVSRTVLFVSIVAAAALALSTACSNSGEKAKKNDESDSNQKPAQVDLPDPPSKSSFQIPEKNPDGTLRIEGIIQYRDKYLDKPVRIKGVIAKPFEECDPSEAKEKGEECPEPHMIIKDDPDADKSLMVVGFKKRYVEESELDLSKGTEHVFQGTYQKVAQGFVASEKGLLLVDKIDEESVLEVGKKEK